MGFILDYITAHSEGRVSSFDTLKRHIDERELDTFGEFEDHKLDSVETDTHKKYAEDMYSNTGIHFISQNDAARLLNKSRFKYFLDGSRHVYKVGDVAIGGMIYPVVAGQIIVGCCQRNERVISDFEHIRKIVLAMPQCYDVDNHGANFFRKKCEDINKALRERNNIPFDVKLDEIIPYRIDGSEVVSGKNKYLTQAIMKIQNEMMDEERRMVNHLCLDGIVGDSEKLIKDGTLEYKKGYSNVADSDLDEAMFDQRIENVVGVSKMFDPELLNKLDPNIGRRLAELPPYSRTNAYRYVHEGKVYCVWYLRIRETYNRATSFSDIIKVEMVMVGKDKLKTSQINNISKNLINEANPVCFGKDSRWANHLYPVYLTESYCKSKYINDQILINLI